MCHLELLQLGSCGTSTVTWMGYYCFLWQKVPVIEFRSLNFTEPTVCHILDYTNRKMKDTVPNLEAHTLGARPTRKQIILLHCGKGRAVS